MGEEEENSQVGKTWTKGKGGKRSNKSGLQPEDAASQERCPVKISRKSAISREAERQCLRGFISPSADLSQRNQKNERKSTNTQD